jgi:hypothetical protein
VKIGAGEYDAFKAFFAWSCENLPAFHATNLAPESHPLTVLESFERTAPAKAAYGLALAIGDIIEAHEHADFEYIQKLDAQLAAEGLTTFSAVRNRFSRTIRAIMKRGRIRSENEYYALRNIVETMNEEEMIQGWQLLSTFEEARDPRGGRSS